MSLVLSLRQVITSRSRYFIFSRVNFDSHCVPWRLCLNLLNCFVFVITRTRQYPTIPKSLAHTKRILRSFLHYFFLLGSVLCWCRCQTSIHTEYAEYCLAYILNHTCYRGLLRTLLWFWHN